MATCKNTSLIWSFVTPFASAPRTWALISCGRFSADSIARFRRLRVFLSKPGRPQISPQQYCVTSSCNGRLKSSAVANALSTKSAPKTCRLIARPFSKTSLSTIHSFRLILLVRRGGCGSAADGVVAHKPSYVVRRGLLRSPKDKRIGRIAGNIDPDAFRLQIFPDCIDATLTPNTRSLISAERRHIADRAIRVHPHRSGFQFLSHEDRSANIGRPNTRCETIDRTVRDLHGFIFVFKGNDGKNRTKDFFVGYAHIRANACEDRRLDEPACATFRTPRRSAA